MLRPGGALAVTVPSWLPEKINWMLSDDYHAPAAVGGHVRIYSATELKAKLRAAGLARGGEPPHARPPLAVLVAALRRRRQRRRSPARASVPAVPRVGHRAPSALGRRRRAGAVASARQEPRGVRLVIPDVPGVLSAEEVRTTAEHLAELQQPSGLIPWFPGGHCDPWNHVESAMALDVAGMHGPAEAAYEWLADVQRPDGSWHNYYWSDGTVEEDKLDTNVCAYVATGVWHHWRCTWDRAFLDHLWPTVERALDWALSLRRPDGLVLWAVEADGTRTWDYALLTGTSSIQHALRCGVALADIVGEPHPEWERAADVMVDAIAERPDGVRAEGALGDGLVLPGADRRADRRGRQGPPRRGLGRVRDGGPRHPLRERRAVGHGVGDGGVRAGLRRHRRPRHGDGAAVVDEGAPAGRRLVLDRPRVRTPTAARASTSRSRSTRRTPPPPWSSPPTRSPAPPPPPPSSPRARSSTDSIRF